MPTLKHFVNFRDRPIVYARIPKVANTSIKVALSKLLQEKPAGKNRVTSDGFWRHLTHGETEMISAKSAWRLRKQKLIFSFVRNPFDRIVSSYNNKILNESSFTPQMAENGYKVGMSFPDFIRRTLEVDDAELDVHMTPQSHMLLHNGLLVPRFVGHFEDMEFQWTYLRKKLVNRYEIVLPLLPRKNVRREDREDVGKYFSDDRIAEIALEKYRKDVEIFYPGIGVDKLISGNFDLPAIVKPARTPTAEDEAPAPFPATAPKG